MYTFYKSGANVKKVGGRRNRRSFEITTIYLRVNFSKKRSYDTKTLYISKTVKNT